MSQFVKRICDLNVSKWFHHFDGNPVEDKTFWISQGTAYNTHNFFRSVRFRDSAKVIDITSLEAMEWFAEKYMVRSQPSSIAWDEVTIDYPHVCGIFMSNDILSDVGSIAVFNVTLIRSMGVKRKSRAFSTEESRDASDQNVGRLCSADHAPH